jgi:methyl-accepting chemotaxis protein
VRLSLFSRLFSRNKPQAVASAASGIPLRTRLDHGAGATSPGLTRTSAIPARPRIPTDTQSMVASADPATDAQKAPVAFGGGRAPAREDELVKAIKMAPQEELSIKITEGLKNLSTVLGAIDQKLAAQSRTTEIVAERLQALPRVLEGLVDSERHNLETLQALRGSMDKQNEVAQQTAEKLDKIPGAVEGLGTKIHEQTEAAAAVKTSVETVSQSVRGLVDGSQRAQNSLITEFRRGQDEQRLRLEDLVERQRKMTLVVFGVAVVLVIGLIVVLTRLPR